MRGAPTGFWGKLDTGQDGVVGWHPLAAHAADVAACCEALLRRTLLGARLAAVAGLGEFEPVQVERLSALAALHDIGKFSVGFQNKALRPPPFTCGHVAEVLALFGDTPYPERDRLCEALPFDDLVAWGGGGEAAFGLLVAAISHHGRPERVGGRHQQSWWRPRGGLDPFEGIAELVGRVRAWFPLAFAREGPSLPEGAPFQHHFSGLVMLADWLGSDRHIFPFAPDEGDRMAFARAAAARALQEIGLDAAGARAALGEAPPPFETLFGFPPRDAQALVAALPCGAPGSVTILESETGSGKTEAALYRFLRLFAAGLVDGLAFALPTRTAATQIHTRVVQAMAHAFADPTTRPPVILAVPGYLAVDEVEGRRLAGFEVLWNDNDQERLRYRGWAAEHPKRYLAGPVVVGTVDQILLSALEVSHAHMRAASLSRQLLVVDEVHASDAYMTRLLEEVLRRHLGAGGQAFLMSATLGSTARCILERPGSRETPSLDQAVAEAYPVVRHSGGGVASVLPVTRGPDREVTVERVGLMGDAVAVAGLAVAAAAEGARVIVLRNTVRGCLDTQRAVEEQAAVELLFRCGGVVAPHHSRYAKEDRQALDRAVEDAFGKGRPEGGCVVVATQTIQQSLDLDADLLITDLCPMDVLLQRMGRLHRHARPARPSGFEAPVCRVLVPADRDLGRLLGGDGRAHGAHGFGTVYEDLTILEATWRALERDGVLRVPSMSRAVVEATTHPDALGRIVSELGGAWARHHQFIVGQLLAHRRLATINLVDTERPFGDYGFPSAEVAGRVATRLGEGDRLAELPGPVVGPFGEPIRRLTIPAWLARGAATAAAPSDVRVDEDALRFTFGATHFRYDRLGLRPDETPVTEEDMADA